jgi:hypothetical protein
MIKKNLIIAVLLTFCIAVTLFGIIPTSGQGPGDYDPWYDVNDDGWIDMRDIGGVARKFGGSGTAINKTELLYNVNDTLTELLHKIEKLNGTILELVDRVDFLNISVIRLDEMTLRLNETVNNLMDMSLGVPDYDSGWIPISQDGAITLTHGLGTTEVLVYLLAQDPISLGINHFSYGADFYADQKAGGYWHSLTQNRITVTRLRDDICWEQIRVMIWKIAEP